MIRANPHPTDVVADASVFSPERIDLVRELLFSTRVAIPPDVEAELRDMRGERTQPLRDLLFPDGQMNPLLHRYDLRMLKDHDWVALKLMNLLHLRKQLLEEPLLIFSTEHGREAVGAERRAILQKLVRGGLGQRSLRLASKGDKRRHITDELLAVCCVLGPILTGRDCFLLTADADVFDQFYTLTQLIHDDYGSFLIAEDLRNHPGRYKHVHEMEHPAMEPGAIAYGRLRDPQYLLPSIYVTCASRVIDVATFEFIVWTATRDIARALSFQNSARDGRVADGGDGRDVHMSINDRACQRYKCHFTVGRDRIAIAGDSPLGRVYGTWHDVFRVGCDHRDIRPPAQPAGAIWMPGLPRRQ
jgi:hypothetical protein